MRPLPLMALLALIACGGDDLTYTCSELFLTTVGANECRFDQQCVQYLEGNDEPLTRQSVCVDDISCEIEHCEAPVNPFCRTGVEVEASDGSMVTVDLLVCQRDFPAD